MTKLTHIRKVEIEEQAEAIAEETFPTSRIEPEELAKQEEITVSFGSYGDAFDGLLEWRRGKFHIYCNLDRVEARDSPRSRFTIAHELGHYFIDDHRRGLEKGRVPSHGSWVEFVSDLLIEQEADTFAASLLMPRRRFLDQAEIGGIGMSAILNASDNLGVSVSAAALKYATLDAAPCAVIKWKPSGEYGWRHTAHCWRRKGISGQAPTNVSELPEDSPTSKAFGEPPPVDVLKAGSSLSYWFRSVPAGSSRDELIVEQAFRLGRYGVLTVLVPAD